MLRSLHTAIGAALLAIGLAACEPGTPPNQTAAVPAATEAIAEGETLDDVVRDKLAEIVRDDDPYARARRLGALLPTLGPELVPSVVETLEDRTVDLGATELQLLLRYWATHRGEEAAQWARTKSPTNFRLAALFSAIAAWAEAEPEAAARVVWPWAVIPDFQQVVPPALVGGWFAAGDPPELRRWLRDIEHGIPRQRAIVAYIRVVVQEKGADAVRRWAESIPDDEEGYKLAVFRRVTSELSKLDVAAGLAWCETHCEGPFGNNMRSLIARTWVLQDGPAALAWLSGAEEGYDRDLAVRMAFAKWSRMDRQAAMDWMATQTAAGEPEPWLRPTYPVYAKLLAVEAPADAIEWALRIDGEDQRETALIQIARVWRHLDEAAAEAWLLDSPLSEEARAEARSATAPQPEPSID